MMQPNDAVNPEKVEPEAVDLPEPLISTGGEEASSTEAQDRHSVPPRQTAPPMPPLPPRTPLPARPAPGSPPPMVVALAVILIIGGVWAVVQSVGVMVASACCWITWLYALPVGIFALIHGLQLLTSRDALPNRTIPILMIICIINCDVLTMVLGIVALVLMSSDEVADYYGRRF